MNGSDTILLLYLLAPVACVAAAWGAIRAYRRSAGTRGVLLVAGNLAILGFLLGGVALGAELYYRFVFDSTEGFQISLTSQRWVDRYYTRNNLGVRDDVDYRRAVAPGKTRLTFLGDSYTAGYGVADVERRFVNLLRRRRPDWEVHMLARNGMDTGAHLDTLRRYLASGHRTDRIVYAYCLNDISDLLAEWNEIAGRIYEERPGFFVENSYAVNTWYWRLRAATDPDLADYFDRLVAAYQGAEWEMQKKRLEQLTNMVRQHGAELTVVIFPFFEFLDSELFASIHRRIAEFFEARGVPCLNLLPIYAEHAPGELIVNRYDTHPNESAHEIAAQEIERALARD